MTYTNEILRPGKLAYWTGWALSGLLIAFLLLASAAPKLFMPGVAIAAIEPLGWSAKHIPLIAGIEIAGVLLYAVPRTSLFGAVLLTGLFGGAMASHLRVDSPLFSHTLFSIYLSLFMWGGLWLRDPAFRNLILRRV
jgi:DoxX-like family